MVSHAQGALRDRAYAVKLTGMGILARFRDRVLAFYERHEARIDIAFFLGGFLFDVLTLSDIDDPFSLLQQFVYLAVIGAILMYDLYFDSRPQAMPRWLGKFWGFRDLAVHFLLGSLFSIYSLFFLKSASVFSSFVFVLLLVAVMVANELKSVKGSGIQVKVALFFTCAFCFFAILFPIALGFVGWLPFFCSLAGLVFFIFLLRWLLKGKVPSLHLQRRLMLPGAVVVLVFFLLYQAALIPPVPLTAKKMGIYHAIEKANGQYRLLHQNPWWRFWHSGDQDFVAAAGDKIHFFASIFSPASFADTVIIHWWMKDAKGQWQTTDKIPMKVTGGREGGYRGFTTKQNYTPGDWCITVETTDEREIGRIYFSVREDGPIAKPRTFEAEVY